VTLIDLTYASPMGGRVPATLVVPDGAGPFAGMLYQHGTPSTRQQMILPAWPMPHGRRVLSLMPVRPVVRLRFPDLHRAGPARADPVHCRPAPRD